MKRKTKEEEIIIERGYGYKIYKKDNLYFLDTYGPFATGFDTLAGARESAYYQGYRETKE